MVSERLTVSQINRYLKFLISGDPKLKTVYVVGEITDFRRNARSGHCYFALKDSESVIRAVMFAGTAQYLRHHFGFLFGFAYDADSLVYIQQDF